MFRLTSLLLCSCFAIAGCATAGEDPADPVDGSPSGVDAPVGSNPDASPGAIDASPGAIDASPAIDAPPEPLPDAAPMCTLQQLLQNADFESGGDNWAEDAGGPVPIISLFPPGNVTPHSGLYVAGMGSFILTSDELYQELTVPAGAMPGELRGYRWIESSDSTVNAYDTLVVSIRNTANTTLATLETWSNVDASAGWIEFVLPLPQDFAGQTIRVTFDASNDLSNVTTFALDSLALQAMVCL